MSLETIEVLAKEHAADRAQLAERMLALNDELDAAKRRRLPGIKSSVTKAKDSHLRLHAAIDGERTLFAKPRSRIFHGIKLGLQKAKGKLSFSSAEDVIRLIKKHFPATADVLIQTTEKPAKGVLLTLSAADLKRVGCTVTGTGDEVLIKPADSEIDKLVDALLGDPSADEDEAA